MFGRWLTIGVALWLSGCGCDRTPPTESGTPAAAKNAAGDPSLKKRLVGTWKIQYGELKNGQSRSATENYQAEIGEKSITTRIGGKTLKTVEYEVVEQRNPTIVIRLSSGATESYTFTSNDELEVSAGDAGARVVFVRVKK